LIAFPAKAGTKEGCMNGKLVKRYLSSTARSLGEACRELDGTRLGGDAPTVR